MTMAKGLDEVERSLMRQMGWHYGLDPHSYSPAWFGEIDGKRWVMPKGWVFGPTGMIVLKRWAAEKKGIVICSQINEGGRSAYAEACWLDEFGSNDVTVEAGDEPTAVALALARALEEMEGTNDGDI